MLSTSIQTATTWQTINLNNWRKFASGRICSIEEKWSEPKLYVKTQNVCPSSIRLQNFESLTNKNFRPSQRKFSDIFGIQRICSYISGNTKSSHHHNGKQISDTNLWNQNDSTTLIVGVWFCTRIQFYYSTHSRQIEHCCPFFITFRVLSKRKKYSKSQRRHSHTTNCTRRTLFLTQRTFNCHSKNSYGNTNKKSNTVHTETLPSELCHTDN